MSYWIMASPNQYGFKTQISEVQRPRHQVRPEQFNKTIPETNKRQGKGKIIYIPMLQNPSSSMVIPNRLFITYINCTNPICFNKPLCVSTCYRHLRSQGAANILFKCKKRWEFITFLRGLFHIYITTDVIMVISLESKSAPQSCLHFGPTSAVIVVNTHGIT